MFCPKCDTETDQVVCPNCNTDILQYTLVDKMSYEAYNKGLTYAKKGDMSKAIECLEEAVKINSSNITALNLLGLCYDKVGRIADASKYWIRSCLVEEDNVASEYIKVVEEKASKRERINESVKMYNQGLIYAKQKSFDIAIIQLKNCIERNGDFVEALNLLSLIYITQGEADKAIPLLRRVLKIDINNEKATVYLESMGYGSPKQSGKREIKRSTKKSKEEKKPQQDKSKKNIIIGFISGVICVMIINAIVLSSQIGFSFGNIFSMKGYEDELTNLDMTISANEIEIESLQDENENLRTENEQLKQDYDVLNVYVSLDKAQLSKDSGDYITSAQIISEISPESVTTDKIDLYNTLKNEVYPKASRSLYDSGVTKYGQGKYDDALVDLEMSIQYGGTVKDYYPSTLFYIGRCKEGQGDNESAKVYYQKIIDEYPQDDIVYSAKSRLNTIS